VAEYKAGLAAAATETLELANLDNLDAGAAASDSDADDSDDEEEEEETSPVQTYAPPSILPNKSTPKKTAAPKKKANNVRQAASPSTQLQLDPALMPKPAPVHRPILPTSIVPGPSAGEKRKAADDAAEKKAKKTKKDKAPVTPIDDATKEKKKKDKKDKKKVKDVAS